MSDAYYFAWDLATAFLPQLLMLVILPTFLLGFFIRAINDEK